MSDLFWSRWTATVTVCVALAALVVATSDRPVDHRGPALALRGCHLEGVAEELRCGIVEVHEDRDRGAGRLIPVHVSVMPALVRQSFPDPLVVLAGGPGQGARTYASVIARFFSRIRRTRDVVLVDLRGTGDSAPLDCPEPAVPIALLAISGDAREAARQCLAHQTADVRLYTHRHGLADLREILQHMGYERVNLWGGSWGTRSALVFAATHPAFVRSVVLDGAVALDLRFPWTYPLDAERALTRLFDDCAADAACRAAFPDPRGDLGRWLSRLEREPFSGSVRHPRTGMAVRVDIDRAAATEILRAGLYSPVDAGLIPMAISRALDDDWGPVLAMAERTSSWSLDTMALAHTMTILCSEDVGRHAAAPVPETVFGTSAIDFWLRGCEGWPRGPGLTIAAETSLATPALILSGDLDPVTPPLRGEAMRRHFPDSLHVVVPGGGHNVSFSGCVPRLIAEFIERGAWQGLDPSCAGNVARPPFVTSLAGGLP